MADTPEKVIDIRTWKDLVGFEQKFSLNRDGKEWVYRGQSNFGYRLTSSLERAFKALAVRAQDRPGIERRIRRDFQRSCHVFAPAVAPQPDDIMAWLALMRHYRAPARLVDFTYSMFIAAYFALKSAKAKTPDKNKEPVIWAINRNWLTDYFERHVVGKIKDTDERKRLKESWFNPYDHEMFKLLFTDREQHKLWLTKNGLKDTDFVAVLNTFTTNDRIFVQQGVFLAVNNVKRSLHEVLEKMDDKYYDNVLKFRIKGSAHDILARLYRRGVNSSSLYPGLQGFAESLGTKILTYRETDAVRRPDQKWWEPENPV